MYTELYIAVMAGFVLAFFLMVSEIVLLRKHVVRICMHLRQHYRSGRFVRLFAGIAAIAAFFLVQPLIVGTLVMMAMDGVDPIFSVSVIRQMRHVLTAITG